MLHETIKYVDYKGLEREETFYFDLSEAELMELELGTTGGYAEMIETAVKSQDRAVLVKTFKRMILMAYGEKSADGRRFMKSEEISRAFSETPAYNKLFVKLSTDPEAAARFVNGIIPKDLASKYPPKEQNVTALPTGSVETLN